MIIEHIKGKLWRYDHAPISKYLMVKLRSKFWHLFDEYDYHGHFRTKKEMYQYIKEIEKKSGGAEI